MTRFNFSRITVNPQIYYMEPAQLGLIAYDTMDMSHGHQQTLWEQVLERTGVVPP